MNNLIQIHERIRLLTDHVASPRWTYSQYDDFINTAIQRIVSDKVDNEKVRKPYSFQSVQKIRDELYTLVKTSHTITASTIYLPIANYPTDFRYLLTCKVMIGSTVYWCDPLTYDEDVDKNPFRRPRLDYPSNVYYKESTLGLEIKFGSLGTLVSGVFEYIKEPTTVTHGTEIYAPNVVASGTNNAIALEQSVYGGVTYSPGQIFSGTGAALTSGVVSIGWINPDLPINLYEEIAKVAASIIQVPTEDYTKREILERENMNG